MGKGINQFLVSKIPMTEYLLGASIRHVELRFDEADIGFRSLWPSF